MRWLMVFNQVSWWPKRLAVAVEPASQDALVLGTTTGPAYTGMQALRVAEQKTGSRPRILGAPGLDTQAVTEGMIAVAKYLRGMVYAMCEATTRDAAITYAGLFGDRELMLFWPATSKGNADTIGCALGLPKLTQKVVDWRNGGMIAPLKSIVGLEALEMDFTNAGLIKTALKDFGASAYDAVVARFSGAYQEDGSGAVSTLVAICIGQYTEIDMGNAKVGEDTAHKGKLSLAYYQLVVDGVEWLLIDVMNNIFRVFGVDRYAEIRAATAD